MVTSRPSYTSQPGDRRLSPGTFFKYRRDKWFIVRQLSCFLFLSALFGVLFYAYTLTGAVYAMAGITAFVLIDLTDDLIILESGQRV